jgi:virginiamycin B lyase
MIALRLVAPTVAHAFLTSMAAAQPSPAPADASPSHSSSSVLAQLPDGEFKRQFIIDCTNCHQMDVASTYPLGRPKTRDEWATTVARMVSYAGAQTGFPIMSPGRNADTTAAWLARYLTSLPVRGAPVDGAARVVERPDVVEYLLPEPRDLPHDVAVDSAGRIVVTGMMTHTMYTLDTASRTFTPVSIPVPRANPRAVEIGANGDWWVLLGGPGMVARHRPGTNGWTTHQVGMYAHSIAIDASNRVWFNGHFTRDPEQLGYVDDATGEVKTFDVPAHPTLAKVPGGPIPYELRVAPDGRVWMSELQGHRIVSFDPATSQFRTHELTTTISAPRRFEIDSQGMLWIPAYAANELVRFDPVTGRSTVFPLPRRDAVPYVVKIAGPTVWIGTNASDEVYAFDTRSRRFTVYPLPTRGAVIRHMIVDPRNGDLWLAYGASPGIPARIARLRP